MRLPFVACTPIDEQLKKYQSERMPVRPDPKVSLAASLRRKQGLGYSESMMQAEAILTQRHAEQIANMCRLRSALAKAPGNSLARYPVDDEGSAR
jgi:hypothetical protein